MDWLKQSSEAAAEGVCHTEEETWRGYQEIPDAVKVPATRMLTQELSEVLPEVRLSIYVDPDHWNVPYHLWWGMSVRNLLRDKGFSEDYFGVDNLDCIYKYLVEDAARD